ncbi:ANTAR domain-containing response regulator [Marasmitruncus massiliensis]|uniref:ANTAR domain-containing response regulator n=1 Tax=Marasmitruncus massiliensis TaxID=1944642 RepID=UPI000C7C43C9|nr:ANTAR domain-containing protein [Marasmitruncus massiliensis]
MGSNLVVSSSTQGQNLLADLLKVAGNTAPVCASSGNEARRMLVDQEFELIIINTPLSDEFGHELAIAVTHRSSAGIILLVKSELADDVSARVEDYGVLVVSKPIGRPLFYQALKLAEASRKRLMGLQSENTRLQSKIEEIRLVDRAKCALIQYLDMTEQQAHRYIEKQAMDLRTTRKNIAQNILQTYET